MHLLLKLMFCFVAAREATVINIRFLIFFLLSFVFGNSLSFLQASSRIWSHTVLNIGRPCCFVITGIVFVSVCCLHTSVLLFAHFSLYRFFCSLKFTLFFAFFCYYRSFSIPLLIENVRHCWIQYVLCTKSITFMGVIGIMSSMCMFLSGGSCWSDFDFIWHLCSSIFNFSLYGCSIRISSTSVSTVSDYRLDDRGSIPVRDKGFFPPACVQTSYGAHPASYPTGTRGKARRGRDADHSPHLVPRLRMSRSYISSTPWRLRGCNVTALLSFSIRYKPNLYFKLSSKTELINFLRNGFPYRISTWYVKSGPHSYSLCNICLKHCSQKVTFQKSPRWIYYIGNYTCFMDPCKFHSWYCDILGLDGISIVT
jgi:hypothetical protein